MPMGDDILDAERLVQRLREERREREARNQDNRYVGGLEMQKDNKETSPGTFGIEFEVNNVSRLCRDLPPGWGYTNDISVQSNATLFRGKPLKITSKAIKNGGRGERVGVEIVSPILKDLKSVVDVLDNIKETGVKTNSKDCGIHIHVSFPSGGAILSLFKLALKYEPIFYAVGTFGGFSRGKYKDYIYQRPLQYPPIVKIAKTNTDLEEGNTYYGYSFDVDKFQTVKDTKDFGEFMSQGTGGKYHGAKYCGINFYSYFYRNTIELRTFNLTTNYSYLKAIVNLSRDFALAGIKEFYSRDEGDKIEVNYINDMSKENILALLEEFLSRYSTYTDKEDIYTLKLLLDNAPKISIPKKVMFHLLFHRNGDNSRVQIYSKKRFLPEKVDIANAIRPEPENLKDYVFEGGLCAN